MMRFAIDWSLISWASACAGTQRFHYASCCGLFEINQSCSDVQIINFPWQTEAYAASKLNVYKCMMLLQQRALPFYAIVFRFLVGVGAFPNVFYLLAWWCCPS